MAQSDNKLLAVWVSLGIIAVLIIIAAIMAYILHRRAKKKQKENLRRRESATILENFKSIEDLAWSYSCHARNQILDDQRPWTYLECSGPIYDGGANSFTRPWILGGKRDNPIFHDSSDSSTIGESPHPSGRKWMPAGPSFDIAYSESLERDLQEWDRDSGTWSVVQQYGVNLGLPERHPSVRSSSIGFGDSLHRELYRWANQGRVKNVSHYRVNQIGGINRKNEINVIKEKEDVSVPMVIVTQSHSVNPCNKVPDVVCNEINRISKQNVKENVPPKMNQKRMSLRDIQMERQKRSGTGDFYYKNHSMFENYKRRMREGGAPAVLYFQY